MLSEISLETKVSGSDSDACGGIALELHQVSQMSSVNKYVFTRILQYEFAYGYKAQAQHSEILNLRGTPLPLAPPTKINF